MTDDYDPISDVWASVDYAYQVIRGRKANGGAGWIPKMSYQRKEVLAEGVELYLADCRDLLPGLGKVDAVVTDPPYGLGELWQGGDANSRGEWKLSDGGAETQWDRQTVDCVVELPAISRSCIIWGGNYYPLAPARGWLVWDKIPRDFTSGDCEFAWTNIDMPARAISLPRSWASFAKDGKSHPTQKPLDLMKWCLGFLPDARTILDPFMGSGTTGVAAAKRGLGFIGIEKHPPYFEIALPRISRALSEPDLFIESPPPPKQEKLAL